MGIFALLLGLISDGYQDEQHNFSKLFFTSTRPPPSKEQFMNFKFADTDIGIFNYSSLFNCVNMSLTNYALVGSENDLKYFDNIEIGLKELGFNGSRYDNPETVDNIVRNEKDDSYCFSLQVDKFDIEQDDYQIQVSWLRNNIPDTNRVPFDPQVKTPDFQDWKKYQFNGFLGIYSVIINAILEAKKLPNYSMDIAYMPLKTPGYESIDPQVSEQLALQFPFFLMFTFLIPLYYITSKLAEEKESKSREGMKMMGLKDSTYFLSWMTTYTTVIFVMSLLIAIMVSFNTFKQTNKVLFFLMNFIYGISLFGFAVVVVALLPTQRSSSLAVSLLHVVTFFVVYAVQSPDIDPSIKIGLSIFPNVGMALSVFNVFHFEVQSSGLTMGTTNVWYANYTFTAGLLMLSFNVLFYLAIGLYLDQVIPSQYGVAKKWNFICTRSFWCGQRRRPKVQEDRYSLLGEDEEAKNPHDFEAVPSAFKRQEETNECLKIRGLRKDFGDKVAVDNTNITMYQGQIFALLGHNGAGKTTTISMLTGLFEPTKGKASVYGIDIFEEMDEMRKLLGVCPQHDVLFEYLTPREHLSLFAAFKRTPINEIEGQVDQMIKDIDLVTVQNQIAKTLSGGQKRKLSVGCAMIGSSKVVILDEPTSGMDTTSRRRLWEMLKANKNGKIVILTTHYMDEADILGDRIAIMAEGKVKCCGSSLFLKNRYGVGYNLVIAKKNRDPAPHIDQFIFSRINGVKKLQEVSSEMNFQLPTQSSAQFKDFFEVFDNNLDQLGIRSYGVGITTLEEVFLRIGRGQDEEEEEEKEELRKFTLAKYENDKIKDKISKDSKIQHNDTSCNISCALEEYSIADEHETGLLNTFTLNLTALLKKKFLLQVREPRTFIIEIFFPIIFIFAGLALSSIQIFREGHPLLLSPTIFPAPNHLYYTEQAGVVGDAQQFVKNYFSYNETEWDLSIPPVQVDTTKEFMEQVSQFDDFIFKDAYSKGQAVYGQYYFLGINEDKPVQGTPITNQYSVVSLINATSQDAVACFANSIHEAILKDITKNPNLKLTVYSTPFPITALEQGVINAAAGTSSSILFAIAYMMVSNSLIQNIIKERQRNVKHQMIISGVSIPAYWISHYLVDLVFQAPPSICAIIGIKAFGLDMPETWVIVLVFIFANPVFVYFFSFLFKNESSASILTRLVYLLTGSIFPIAVSILQVFPSTADVGKVLRWFFYILPVFSLNFGVVNIAKQLSVLIFYSRKVMALVEKRDVLDPLDFLVAGPSVLFLVLDIFFYWFLIILFEINAFTWLSDNVFCRRRHQQEIQNSLMQSIQEDEDVIEEEQRIQQVEASQCTVKLNNVKKLYGKTLAVDKVSFGLEYGECFALLGVSGAGKTTTFKCLTGEEKPTIGDVYVNGFDVTTRQGFDSARRLIGYCPQFDAIFDGLTVKEHLEFYAKVKGVVTRCRNQIIERQMEEMDLKEFENVRAEKLSGGNKRKLSVAMAMIGNPPIVFLDEPSTGVDPKAKRFMWSIVSKISTQRKKSSVIITTHSMEEAEALCTKMGIMVAGRFKCFGSAQHIKAKYGTGYEIEIKIRTLKEEDIVQIQNQLNIQDQPIGYNQLERVLQGMNCGHLMAEIKENGLGDEFYKELQSIGSIRLDELIRWAFTESKALAVIEKFEAMFKSVEVLEHYNNSYLIKVSRDNYSIGYLFGMMEDNKVAYDISEYSVSQTTLEQIFNNFAKDAEKNNPRRRTTQIRRGTQDQQNQSQIKENQDVFRLETERMQTVALDKSRGNTQV